MQWCFRFRVWVAGEDAYGRDRAHGNQLGEAGDIHANW